jgi:hypothetical protein
MYPFFLESTISKTRDEQLAPPVEPPADLSTLDARLCTTGKTARKTCSGGGLPVPVL